METSIPITLHSVDVMAKGPGAPLKDAHAPVHPVQVIQQQHLVNQHELKKQLLGKVYGGHFPMRMTMEEKILGQIQPGPGQTSKHVGLETLLNRDTTIDFTDYLNDPQYRETMVNAFTQMETRLGDVQTNASGL